MEETEASLPFKHQPGERIGSGWESLVHELGPDWVIKEINPIDEHGEEKNPGWIEEVRTPERVKAFSKEQQKLEEIFGKERFNRVYFVEAQRQPHDEKGEVEYLMIQKRVQGEKMSELDGEVYRSEYEMVRDNREEYKELIWGSKKAFIELGAPIDFHEGNLVQDKETGRVNIVDCGFPSESRKHIFQGKGERSQNALVRAYERLDKLHRLEGYLDLSDEEVGELNQKYGIDEESFLGSVKALDSQIEEQGLTKKYVEQEIRKRTLDGFFDEIFGDREKVSGREILDAVFAVIGDDAIPKKKQEILDELKELDDAAYTRKQWKNFIQTGNLLQ